MIPICAFFCNKPFSKERAKFHKLEKNRSIGEFSEVRSSGALSKLREKIHTEKKFQNSENGTKCAKIGFPLEHLNIRGVILKITELFILAF
ncbi:hypothetical protein CH373_16145 [Leptospira perolatii]|uniref:Uncharacterized protein n=1 Tax=Leptospira perolatii TaxID=2023191 RepID=A0A2M9ZJ91_9LEPT|nr:hypothetical protein CH360_16345 [Leptospira perolatii]PJZ72126.1 hypothetical protein CH373_16145 [Leptospira perolatii]